MRKYIVFIALTVLFITGRTPLNAQIVRGSGPGEIYMYGNFYISPAFCVHMGVFHSTDNGENITPQYTTIMDSGYNILADSLQGVAYLTSQFGVKRSTDYGKNWQVVYNVGGNNFASGSSAGEVYKAGKDGNIWGLYRSIDFGSSFQIQNSNFPYILLDCGSEPGEVYGYSVPYPPVDTIKLIYSNDWGHSFSTIVIDTSLIISSELFGIPGLSRGTTDGEFYLIRFGTDYKYHIFHTFDRGKNFEFEATSAYCQDCNPYPNRNYSFTAGREPGSFYIMRDQLDSITLDHYNLCIDYSQDYGKTYVTHCYTLDSTFDGIPAKYLPEKAVLGQNFPNPFMDKTSISFSTPSVSSVEIAVQDLLGNQVKTLTSSRYTPGQYETSWDGTNDQGKRVTSGIYILRMKCNGMLTGTRKAVVL